MPHLLWGILSLAGGLPGGANVVIALALCPLFLTLDIIWWIRRRGLANFLSLVFSLYFLHGLYSEYHAPPPPLPMFIGPNQSLAYRFMRIFVREPVLDFGIQVLTSVALLLRGMANLLNALAGFVEVLALIQ